MIRSQQIDTLSNLMSNIAIGLFLGAFGIQFFTGLNVIIFLKTILLGFVLAFLSLKVLELKQDGKSSN